MTIHSISGALAICAMLALTQAAGSAQTGSVSGNVVLEANGNPLEHATVLLVQLRRSADTNQAGYYLFQNVPPGTYDVVAHMHSLTGEQQRVRVEAGGTAVADFRLRLAPVREQITVTASGREETQLETFQSVTSLESVDLSLKSAASLGDVLENESGVAKRSFGPGTTRPVIRGFDGDRVLVLQDGIRTGTLSSQSGDHGEPIEPNAVERVEVVRGPATLLYGSNALGGVVNVITGHHQVHQHPHAGLRGYLTGIGGTNNARGGGAAGLEYGFGKWLLWGDSGGQRTGDYHSALGEVPGSGTDLRHGNAGIAYYGTRNYANGGYTIYAGGYDIPYDPSEEDPEIVELRYRRHNARLLAGRKDIGNLFEQFQLTLNYSDWNHQEKPGGVVANEFFNKQFVYRGVFEQKKRGPVTGSFGFWGLRRDYKAVGEEAITPPVTQDGLAGFLLEQFSLERFRIQAGGRLEHNRYNPSGAMKRSFTGFSGAAGMSTPLWRNGVAVVNYSHSERAPALEELYAFGPHAGNLTFEIGDVALKREKGDGIEASVRHQAARIHAEANFFHYQMADFVYLAPTGRINDGLIEARYTQADSRYRGAEGHVSLGLSRSLWMNLGVDAVSARLKVGDTPLPRIPPVRGKIGLDGRIGALSVMPEIVLSDAQRDIFPTETQTAGYAAVNVRGIYTVTRGHALHVFGANFFNAGNRLYRNHLSFIKEFAPEIGRGVQFSYTVRFF